MFLATFDITVAWIKTIVKKILKKGSISPDRRGKHLNRVTKISEKVIKTVVDHSNSFVRVPSHYIRKDSNREYLEQSLSISAMHNYYKIWLAENKIDVTPASFRQYNNIFETKFNIRFFKPKKDQCDTCVSYKNSTCEEKELRKQQYYQHTENKEKDRKIHDEAKKFAKLCFLQHLI